MVNEGKFNPSETSKLCKPERILEREDFELCMACNHQQVISYFAKLFIFQKPTIIVFLKQFYVLFTVAMFLSP